MICALRSLRPSCLLKALLKIASLEAFRLEAREGHCNSWIIVVTLSCRLYFFWQNLAAFLWIASTAIIWPTLKGSQTEDEYSTIGLTRVLYAAVFTAVDDFDRASLVTYKALFALLVT